MPWRRRAWKPALVLLVLNLAVFAGFTLPRLLQRRSVTARAAALRADVALARERTEAARQRALTLRQNEADARQFLESVVADRRESLVPVLQEVVGVASSLGLRVRHQAYAPEPLKELPVVRFKITMPLEGTYAQLGALLDRLERSPRFLTVDQISLRQQGAAGTGQASLDLQLSAYFRAGNDDER